MSRNEQKKSNRLIHEQSPYLLQHAFNPVDWYPWGNEAFEQANAQDKPVFLSIGYSTCHWCHVMEKESFEDPDVAELLNTDFICVKVDREERPDIDGIYMNVCQMLTQRGGWPLTVLLTADKKPFFAGTYFPRNSRAGQVGMLQLLPQIARLWKERREDLRDSADKIIAALKGSTQARPSAELGQDVLDRAFQQLDQDFDEERGGFGRAPKFPTPHHLTFLLRYWKRTGKNKALHMVEKTLTAMRKGGIWDHIGSGFHRYSTDSGWLLPHFEKMLYDQALIAWANIETWLATQNPLFRETAEEIFAYVLRDMTSPEGAFYSAEDADSEGIEGKFYTWSTEEVREVLGPQDAEFFGQLYNLLPQGNFQEETGTAFTGRNIPHLTLSWEEFAERVGSSIQDIKARAEAMRSKLFSYREKRTRPLRDDKILTDWNGLMLAALAKGAQAFDKPEYAQAAERAVRFIWEHLYSPREGLLHRHKDGVSGIPAYADDYAFLIWGLIELYQATFNTEYLEKALDLNRLSISRFWDKKDHGFFFTSESAESLFLRKKESYDGALPSSNSAALFNLLRLGRLSGDPELLEKADQLIRRFSGDLQRHPSGYTHMLCALGFSQGPSQELVIVGDPPAEDTQAKISAIRTRFFPNLVVHLLAPDRKDSPVTRLAPYTVPYKSLEGKATAYVCSQFSCREPTTDLHSMLRLLEEGA